MNLKYVLDEFHKYRTEYPNNDKVHLKVMHMLRVMNNSLSLASKAGLDKEQIELAGIIALLHDIGRFEQIKRFNTFVDKDSLNHAEYSADLLKKGLIKRFVPDTRFYDDVIIDAVRYHSRFKLPENLKGISLFQAQIIRDADKIDIYHQLTSTNADDIFNGPVPSSTSRISEKVFREFLDGHCIKNEDMKTKLDDYVRKCALIYDFNFPRESSALLKESDSINYITQGFLSAYPITDTYTLAQIETVRTTALRQLDRNIFLEKTKDLDENS